MPTPSDQIDELLRQVRTLQSLAERVKPYYVVVVADDPTAGKAGVYCTECPTAGDAIDLLRPLVGKQVHVFVFRGDRCQISPWPYHLETPDGAIAIIAPAPDGTLNRTGWLGLPAETLALSTESAPPGGVADADDIIGPMVADDDDDDGDGAGGFIEDDSDDEDDS